jgi:hypothetical protein
LLLVTTSGIAKTNFRNSWLDGHQFYFVAVADDTAVGVTLAAVVLLLLLQLTLDTAAGSASGHQLRLMSKVL